MTKFDERPWGGERLDDDPFALWDGAYVLGSLSSTERREYETHLISCASCREAVSALSGMPALLALLGGDEVKALDGDQPQPPALRPVLLESLLAKVSWRRRRTRVLTWAVVSAAAAVLAVGLVFAIRPSPWLPAPEPPQVTASALTLMKVAPTALDAKVMLFNHGWGTSIEMTCSYRERSDEAEVAGRRDDEGGKLAMVVVGRDGSHSELATWTAQPGKTALPAGSSSLQIEEIVAVQVVSADNGDVLLQRNL